MKKSIFSFMLGAAVVTGIILSCGSFIAKADCKKCISDYLKKLNQHYDTVQTLAGTKLDMPGISSFEMDLQRAASGRIGREEGESYNSRFVTSANFKIPCAWTFDAADVRAIARMHDSDVTRIKLYAALDTLNTMTLVMLGVNPHERDIVEVNSKSVMLEYADPCPPKCGVADQGMFTSCMFKVVRNAKNENAACNEDYTPPSIEEWIKRNRR